MRTKLVILLLAVSLVTGAYGQEGLNWVADSLTDEKPNVIIIDIDRLNSERMPCYGYERNTTPNLCRFGENNLFFKQSVSQAGWTASSVTSVFTSQYTGTHDVEEHGDSLDDNYVTMAEVFRSEGYRTAAVPSYPEYSPVYVHEEYNVDQGFQEYYNGSFELKETYSKFSQWQDDSDQPFFAFIQGFDPHYYAGLDSHLGHHYRSREPPEEFTKVHENGSTTTVTDTVIRNGSYYLKIDEGGMMKLEEEDVQYINDQYDDSLKALDGSFGAVMNDLKRKGLYSDSIIIVFANHGEMLDSRTFAGIDRRFGHGQIWDDDIQTTLMIHLPEGRDRTVERQVQLIDIFPTVLEEAGITPNDSLKEMMQGQSLTPLYRTNLFNSYTADYAFSSRYRGQSLAVRNSTWKYVKNLNGKNTLYNLEKDEDENNNVIDEYPEIADAMSSALKDQQLKNQRLKTMIESGE